MVYVTHDQVEAMTMGTRIVVMKDGVIQQVAPPRQLYDEPANLFVAGFIGSPQMNFIDGIVTLEDGRFYFSNKRMKLLLPPQYDQQFEWMTRSVRNVVLGVRPENVMLKLELSDAEYGDLETIQSIVQMTEVTGADSFVYVTVGDSKLIVRTDPMISYRKDDAPAIAFNMGKLHFFDVNTGESLAVGGDEG
jgi:multiple sugar transport system ATP-binding protein